MARLYRRYDLAERAARALIAGLDRSVLGSFAVDEEVLFSVMRSCMVTEKTAMDGGYILDNAAQRMCDSAGVEVYQAEAEVMLWRGIKRCRLMSDYMSGNHAEWLSMLGMVSESPREFLPYFEAGFWDTRIIESLVADGVDAEMALTIAGG